MPKLAKTRVTVCAVKVYTDTSTYTPLTTFTKSSIALRTLLCLYSRYVINCLRKVSETTSAPILWIGSPPRCSARRPPPLVRAEEVSAWCVGCDIVQADHAPEAGVAQGIFHGILVRHHGRIQEGVEEGLEDEVERHEEEENTQEQVRMPMTMDGNEDTQTRLEPRVTMYA